MLLTGDVHTTPTRAPTSPNDGHTILHQPQQSGRTGSRSSWQFLCLMGGTGTCSCHYARLSSHPETKPKVGCPVSAFKCSQLAPRDHPPDAFLWERRLKHKNLIGLAGSICDIASLNRRRNLGCPNEDPVQSHLHLQLLRDTSRINFFVPLERASACMDLRASTIPGRPIQFRARRSFASNPPHLTTSFNKDSNKRYSVVHVRERNP